MVSWQPLSWVPPRLAPPVPPWLWPRPPMLFGRRDLLAEHVASVSIRCRACGRMTPVVRGGVCRSCGSDAMAMLVARPRARLRVDPMSLLTARQVDRVTTVVTAQQVDEATAAHIAEQVRDAYAFGEVTIGRRDVGVDHRDVIRSATLRSFRQGR